jgi:hypothetical protein
MAELRCVDGSVLSVLPVPCLDRDGVPYEVTLRLLRDGRRIGEVGERCGFFLAHTAARLRAARADDPEAYPSSGMEAGLRAWAVDHGLDADGAWRDLARYLPRDREVFAFRARDPDDVSAAGELRVVLREERSWVPPGQDGSRGRWRLRCLAVLECWDAGGVGVRAVLDSAALLAFLEQLLVDCSAAGVPYDGVQQVAGLRRPVG